MVDVGEKLESKTNDKPTETIKEIFGKDTREINSNNKTKFIVHESYKGTKALSVVFIDIVFPEWQKYKKSN